MSHNSYNNIKKYAAFIFMIFTVISGSPERLDSGSFVKPGRKAFIDILAANKQFIQNKRIAVNQSGITSTIEQNEGFIDFLNINVDDSGLKHLHIYILGLLIPVYYLNNSVLRNSIWKNAVF